MYLRPTSLTASMVQSLNASRVILPSSRSLQVCLRHCRLHRGRRWTKSTWRSKIVSTKKTAVVKSKDERQVNTLISKLLTVRAARREHKAETRQKKKGSQSQTGGFHPKETWFHGEEVAQENIHGQGPRRETHAAKVTSRGVVYVMLLLVRQCIQI